MGEHLSREQRRVGQALFDAVHDRFPDVVLRGMQRSPEDPRTVWVVVQLPADEDREIAVREFAAERSTDLLLEGEGSALIASGVAA